MYSPPELHEETEHVNAFGCSFPEHCDNLWDFHDSSQDNDRAVD